MPAKPKVPDTIPLYNVNDGVEGRNGGPYLDDMYAKQQEERNARLEKRKPDYSDKHLATVVHPGTVLVSAEQLVAINSGPGGADLSEIKATVYSEIKNPVLVTQEAIAANVEIAAKRANFATKQAELEAAAVIEAELAASDDVFEGK